VARRAASVDELWRAAAANVPVLLAMRRMLDDESFEAFGAVYRRVTAEHSQPDGDGVRLELVYTRVLARR
jgi:hypothetical protein